MTKPAPAPRTPLCPLALTLDDVDEGVAFIRYNLTLGSIKEDVFTTGPFWSDNFQMASSEHSYNGVPLTDAGIAMYGGCPPWNTPWWNNANFAVANTVKRRRQFVTWLIARGDYTSEQAAVRLVRKHLNEFVSVELDCDGKLVACLTI